MELSSTSPLDSNAKIIRRTKNSSTKLAPERSTATHENKAIADKSDSILIKLLNFADVLLRFIRPHLLLLILAGFAAVFTRTWMENTHLIRIPKLILCFRTTAVFVGLVCADGYTSGINHIYDIEIDKINKPHYPLVSGELSLRFAWILTISFMVVGIAISLLLQSGALLAYLLSHLVMGTLYSVPPVSLKKSTIGAVLTTSLGRGVVFMLGSSGASRTILGLPFQLSPQVVFMAINTSLFGMVIGALKDLEDLEGDKEFNVPTLPIIYGPRKVAFVGFGIILTNYVGAITTAILVPQDFRQSIIIPVHVILASYAIFKALKWDKENYTKEASHSIINLISKLFIIEYIIFPFI